MSNITSIAATPSAKELEETDPNKVIGKRARDLSHLLSSLKISLAMNKVTLICVDQVRANMKIEGPYAKRADTTVGTFGNFKAATNINSIHHNIKQWCYFTRGSVLKVNDPLGVDGWMINVHMEKNKSAPSQVGTSLVFDKKFGVIPQLSEYVFLRDMSSFEVTMTGKNEKKLAYPLSIDTVGKSKIIKVIDPETHNVLEQTDKFTERNFMKIYWGEPNFKRIFDRAVDMAVEGRIIRGIFRSVTQIEQEQTPQEYESGQSSSTDTVEQDTTSQESVSADIHIMQQEQEEVSDYPQMQYSL